MSRRRIAFCSPVNPAPSGISDYSEELLPYLGQYADITLYVAHRLRPDNPLLAHHLPIESLRSLERHHRHHPYDAILYHMGNSPAHADIWRVAQRVPGVVVFHDFVLHHFMLWYAANVDYDIDRYVQEMGERYGDRGAHIAQLMIRGRFSEAAFDFPCCEPVVAAATGAIVHSAYVRERVAALRPALPIGVVPMGVPLPPLIDRAAARERLGVPTESLVLASFGHINAYKRLEPALQAVLELRGDYPNVRYILVGSVSPNYDVRGLIQRMGLSEVVAVTGYVPRSCFEDYVAAADICLNLRHPTAGETSASLLRLLGAGRPTLVSATGAFAELPPGVAAQVDVHGGCERDLILAYCRLLASRPDVAAALGHQARQYVAAHHTLDQAARGYMHVLAQLYQWQEATEGQDRKQGRGPLWEPSSESTSSTRIDGTSGGGAGHTERRWHWPWLSRWFGRGKRLSKVGPSARLVDAPEALTPDPSPRAGEGLSTSSAPYGDLVSRAAQRLVEMGITEQDEAVLHTVAQQIWEMNDP